MKRSFGCAVVLLVASVCGAQDAPGRLKASDLAADAAILRSAYEQMHPGLYRYNSRAQMDADFTALDRSLDHDQTLGQAFVAFSEFAAKVRCGHTQANPFNQSKTVVETLFKTPTRLPFYFEWLEGEMVVTRDFTPGHLLPAGTRIAKVNGVATPAILARLLPIARADGANDSKRVAQLAVSGDSLYEAFDLYYPLYFPQQGASDALLVRRPGSAKAERVTVAPLSYEERIAPIREREQQRKGSADALFQWKVLGDGSALLKMPTWALYDSKWDWKQWLDEHLDEAAASNAPALILDLRGNEGGDDVGNVILPHLIDAPMTLSPMRRFVRYRRVPDELAPYLETWDKSFRDWGASAVDLAEPWPTAPAGVRYFHLVRANDSAGDVVQPAAKRFRGKVLVLIDATNSSATFQFAQNLQLHHLGTLVGGPTGGSQRGINGGAFFFLRLPHSGIEMDVPLIATFPPSAMPDTGITPEILVKPTAEAIADGTDPVLSAALRTLHR